MTRPDDITDFQWRVIQALHKADDMNNMMNGWEVLWNAFPEKSKKLSGRGAFMGNLRRSMALIPHLVGRLDPKDEHDTGTYYLVN